MSYAKRMGRSIHSIRARLTLWLALLMVVCMAVFGFCLYVAEANALTTSVDQTLRVQAQQVASSYDFGSPANGNETGQHVDISAVDQFATANLFVETFDTQGQPLARSQNLGHLHLPDETHAAMLLHASPHLSTQAVPGSTLRVYSLPAVRGGSLIGLVMVATSLQEVTATTQTLLMLLIVGSIGVGLLTIIGGGVLVRRGLYPLDEMATVAEGITAWRLDQRLVLRNRAVEVERLADTFNVMLNRLDEAFTAQRRFVADASHELRTPLATLLGRCEVLLLNPGLPADTRSGLVIMRDESARMGRMVANLLLLAHGDDVPVVARRPVELDTLLLEVGQQAHSQAVGVMVAIAHIEQAEVLGDADLLKQALLNLADNALSNTPPGGRVALSLAVEDGHAYLAVRDTGPGIAGDHLPHIFERFYRVDTARSRRSGGAGLGLSIVRAIAEAHGGHVAVESIVGQGSMFTIVLPLSDHILTLP
jgi:two-component system, OmpR family, sensor kinase